MATDLSPFLADSANLGRAMRLDDAQGRYIEFVKQTFPKGLRLDGLRVVIDCANGAGYKVAPTVLWELGADVVPLGVEPNGVNINHQCGSTYPVLMQAAVVKYGADIGIALDGHYRRRRPDHGRNLACMVEKRTPARRKYCCDDYVKPWT